MLQLCIVAHARCAQPKRYVTSPSSRLVASGLKFLWHGLCVASALNITVHCAHLIECLLRQSTTLGHNFQLHLILMEDQVIFVVLCIASAGKSSPCCDQSPQNKKQIKAWLAVSLPRYWYGHHRPARRGAL